MIRFHLDEHVDHAIAHALRNRGVDVTTSPDAGLLGASDEEQLAFAHREGRVIVTHDADFLRLASSGEPHSGIVHCSPGAHSLREIHGYLYLMHYCLADDDMVGKVEYLR